MGREDPVAERMTSRSVILSDARPRQQQQRSSSWQPAATNSSVYSTISNSSSNNRKNMPVSSRRQSRADDEDDDDEDILDAEDDEYDPFAAASSIDPDGRLMSEPSVIAMSPAVPSVKERSIASGSFNSSRANPYNRSLGSTRGGRDHEEDEECKEELTLSPFDYSVDNSIAVHGNSQRVSYSRPSDKIHFGSDWEVQECDGESSSSSSPGQNSNTKVEAATNSHIKSTTLVSEVKRAGDDTGLFSSNRNRVIGAVVLMVVVILVVVLSVVLANGSPSPTVTASPTATPQSEVCSSMSKGADNDDCIAIVKLLEPAHPNRTLHRLSINGTCQNDALLWLLTLDNIATRVMQSDPLLQYQYALGVAHCELEGPRWREQIEDRNGDLPCFRNHLSGVWFNSNCNFTSVEINGNQVPIQLRRVLAPELSMANLLEKIVITNIGSSGVIPSEFGLLTQLQILDLSNNALTGSIPFQILTPNLEELLLHNNKLNGTFPVEQLVNAPNLTRLSIYGNADLSGDLCTWNGSPNTFFADKDQVNCTCCNATLPTTTTATPSTQPSSIFDHIPAIIRIPPTPNPSASSAPTPRWPDKILEVDCPSTNTTDRCLNVYTNGVTCSCCTSCTAR